MTDLGVGIVGAGYWGPNLIRNFTQVAGAQLRAVCDLDARRREDVRARYPEVAVTDSLTALLDDPAIDAMVVATPAETHRAIGERCLAARKHLFIEKPLATTSEDARALVRIAEDAGRTLMVGHLFLHDAAVRRAMECVLGGTIGSLRYITSIRTSMGGTARLDTNIVWDAVIHDAYVVPSLVGRAPTRVQANGRGYLSGLEDVAFAVFDFGDDLLASCYTSWYALEKARRITIVGSEGVLLLDELSDPPVVVHRNRYVAGDERDAQGRLRWRWLEEGTEPQPISRAEPLAEECKHFVECIQTGARPLADGVAGLEAVLVVEACDLSIKRDGAWVSIPG